MSFRLFKGRSVEDYMTNKASSIKLVAFTAIFSLCFINIYKPFGSNSWYAVSPIRYFVFSSLLVLTGILVIAFSRFLMYRFVRKHSIYYIEYALWILGEIIVLSGIYTVYTIAINKNLNWWNMEDIITVFKNANINTVLIVVLPYAVSWLYFSYEDKKSKLAVLERNNKLSLEQTKKIEIIQFFDEKGEMRFSVTRNHIIYIEAADNYVLIRYKNKGKLSDFMLRNSIKRISEQLAETSIKRCHRSYMVNLEHVIALRKNNDGIILEFDIEVKNIPVSHNYNSVIMDAFVKYSNAD